MGLQVVMIPIIVCTTGSKCLPVMKASVENYGNIDDLVVHRVEKSNFGDCYNAAMTEAFKTHDEIIIANDDVVLTPDTMRLLLEDVNNLRTKHKLGFVATRADNIRPQQNIRNNEGFNPIYAQVVSPVFTWISKSAFEDAQFPPINWYGDDVMCLDLNRKGYKHFISRAYVHHVGSTTIGTDVARLNAEAKPWIEKNRPEYLKYWFKD